jgi:hypothetical protein
LDEIEIGVKGNEELWFLVDVFVVVVVLFHTCFLVLLFCVFDCVVVEEWEVVESEEEEGWSETLEMV